LLYFIGLFEFVVIIIGFGFVVVIVDGATSEFDEADFLNSVSFDIEILGVI